MSPPKPLPVPSRTAQGGEGFEDILDVGGFGAGEVRRQVPGGHRLGGGVQGGFHGADALGQTLRLRLLRGRSAKGGGSEDGRHAGVSLFKPGMNWMARREVGLWFWSLFPQSNRCHRRNRRMGEGSMQGARAITQRQPCFCPGFAISEVGSGVSEIGFGNSEIGFLKSDLGWCMIQGRIEGDPS